MIVILYQRSLTYGIVKKKTESILILKMHLFRFTGFVKYLLNNNLPFRRTG